MTSTETDDLDNSPHARRIVQALVDLRGGDLTGARILDLGSAHGLYTIECAVRGARSLGLEGRATWISHAVAARDTLGVAGADFRQEDVRNISVQTHGVFDVCLCLGLLYHLTAEEAFSLVTKLYDMSEHFIVIDTQFALAPQETVELGGRTYSGCRFPEHPPGSSPEAMEAELGAALDSEFSFWFTLPSLVNMLGAVGFTTVYELSWPTEHLYKNGEFRVHEDYVTVVAMKGRPVGEVYGTRSREGPLARAPEDRGEFLLQRSWSAVGWSNARAQPGAAPHGGAEARARRTIRARLGAAARALLAP